MNSFGIFGIMTAVIVMFGIIYNTSGLTSEDKAQSSVLSFIAYRNSVNAYALEHKIQGSIADSALKLAKGITRKNWANRIVAEQNGDLYCYVYGAATPEEFSAIQSAMNGSATLGWKHQGILVRNGSALPLPAFIPDNNIVSVINLK